MAKYVIDPGIALQMAEGKAKLRSDVKLLAPTLLRSQVLALLFGAVQQGSMTRQDANRRLDRLRGMQLRLLGDRVLQAEAWNFAQRLGWTDTFVSEYVALTKLQADALVTSSADLADALRGVVPVAPIEAIAAS